MSDETLLLELRSLARVLDTDASPDYANAVREAATEIIRLNAEALQLGKLAERQAGEITQLTERLEDKTNSLRVEIAAKQGAHNEIKILDGALRSAIRRLDEGHDIKPESQAHGDMRDALT